jgi:spermidine/putrescine transport system ATP-binding protein
MTALAGTEAAARHDRTGDVEVDHVVKDFGDVRAVDHVSFALEPGTFFALLGPSGCGKTTLLRMIAGFEQPTDGDIRIGGQSVLGVPAYRRHVNTVFQQYALFPHMNVAQNVGYGPRQRKLPKPERERAVEEALELVRLAAYGHRRTWELSGGQQQRVALARALINRPTVLLLDEPLGALDLKLRREMQVELKRLQREVGITFIFVTHDQNEALSMADRIAVMRSGHVLQDGSPAEVYEAPVDRWVADFIGQMNFIPATVEARDATRPDGWILRTERGLQIPASGLAESIAVGHKVALALRPERIRIAPAPDDAAGDGGASADGGVQPGRVASVAYLGDQVEVLVDAPALGEVLARVANDGRLSAGSLRPGEEVLISWEPAAARVVVDTPVA